MCTLLWLIYYDLAGKNISLEGQHLVLTLLASIIGKNLKESDKSNHQMCSIKKLFLKILQYSQENNCVGVSMQ